MTNYTITGEQKRLNHGLVDFLADGYIERDGDKIPCQIGFTEFGSEIEATHIFIKSGVTESGNHYESETIEL